MDKDVCDAQKTLIPISDALTFFEIEFKKLQNGVGQGFN
jgi:hypothetical protein